mmetsp:Transcript_22080/g.33365  ORF Transcript_22080/g.33365 Transcript_22080/m.33365 type:complete len:507 (+) Transcript_22080:145-1665(+)
MKFITILNLLASFFLLFFLECHAFLIGCSSNYRPIASFTLSCIEDNLKSDALPTSNAKVEIDRRKILEYGAASTFISFIDPAQAATSESLDPKQNAITKKEIMDPKPVSVETASAAISMERRILQILPVKNTVFRTLEDYVIRLSSLRSSPDDEKLLEKSVKSLESAIDYLDNNRRSLEPVFNEDDDAVFQIEKAERGERVIETFRSELSILLALGKVGRISKLLDRQKTTLLALADIGELLVSQFPLDVPEEGKFSFLPRLLGRCKVTLLFKRDNKDLGTATILADGFIAPVTAGNFIDLCMRGFYDGLPIKTEKKRFGGSISSKTGFLPLESLGFDIEKEESDPASPSTVVSLPILGSYRDGFYDPLTGKPRRIPLEILCQDSSSGLSKLSYESGFSELDTNDSIQSSKPLIDFELKGLVAFNHERNPGSSEFFVLPDTMPPDKRRLVNRQYAPFGYITDGYDVIQSLKTGDVISEISVNNFGVQNLAKIRGTSFSDVVQRDDE